MLSAAGSSHPDAGRAAAVFVPARRHRRRTYAGFVSGAGVGLLITAAVVGLLSFRTVPTRGGAITIDFHSPSYSINPLTAWTDTDLGISNLVFPGLLRWNVDGTLTGALADRVTISDGGRRITVGLRAGIHWQNRRPVTARDVVTSYRRLANPAFPAHSQAWDGVRIRADGLRTVVITLPTPDYTFLSNLTTAVVPAGFSKLSTPTGSGPYTFGQAKPGEVDLHLSSTSSTQSAFIRSVSFRLGPGGGPPSLSCRAELQPVSGTVSVPATRLLGLTLNTRVLPQRLVRLALIESLAQTESTSHLALSNPLPVWPASLSTSPFLTRPVRPASLLHLAGWTRSHGLWRRKGRVLAVELAATRTPAEVPFLSQIAQIWTRLGVRVTTLRSPFATFVASSLGHRTFGAALVDWDFASPDYNPIQLWGADRPLNFSGLKDKRLDGSLAAIPLSQSRTTRDRLRTSAGNELIRDGVAVGLSPGVYSCVVASGVHGFAVPGLVTNAGDLLADLANWYVSTKIEFHNPL